jgi:hypothetical protein
MPRIIRQPLPDPPKAYDQPYMFRLVNALNLLGLQITAEAEWIAARFIATAPVYVDPSGEDPNAQADTANLPTGLLYFLRDSSQPLGSPHAYFFTIVS